MITNTPEIVRLSPESIPDYLNFFENVAHTDNPEWDRCYCLNFCSASNTREAKTIFSDPDVRREYAADYIRKGILRGYLAYMDGQVAGWCNANDKNSCLECFGNYFIYGDTAPQKDERKVKSVYCFTVAPKMRRRHIATALLERVISDAAAQGYDCVEAYPEKGDADQYYNFPGYKELYKKMGFLQVGEAESRLIFRKDLRKDQPSLSGFQSRYHHRET